MVSVSYTGVNRSSTSLTIRETRNAASRSRPARPVARGIDVLAMSTPANSHDCERSRLRLRLPRSARLRVPAYHEAGHAVVAHQLGFILTAGSIVSGACYAARCSVDDAGVEKESGGSPRVPGVPDRPALLAVVGAAGAAAETLLTGAAPLPSPRDHALVADFQAWLSPKPVNAVELSATETSPWEVRAASEPDLESQTEAQATALVRGAGR
jgi:hypothetical protein